MCFWPTNIDIHKYHQQIDNIYQNIYFTLNPSILKLYTILALLENHAGLIKMLLTQTVAIVKQIKFIEYCAKYYAIRHQWGTFVRKLVYFALKTLSYVGDRGIILMMSWQISIGIRRWMNKDVKYAETITVNPYYEKWPRGLTRLRSKMLKSSYKLYIANHPGMETKHSRINSEYQKSWCPCALIHQTIGGDTICCVSFTTGEIQALQLIFLVAFGAVD